MYAIIIIQFRNLKECDTLHWIFTKKKQHFNFKILYICGSQSMKIAYVDNR